jgi:hypothetical protein
MGTYFSGISFKVFGTYQSAPLEINIGNGRTHENYQALLGFH